MGGGVGRGLGLALPLHRVEAERAVAGRDLDGAVGPFDQRPGAGGRLGRPVSARHTNSRRPASSVNAPGYGWVSARTQSKSARRPRVQSMRPSSGRRRGMTVASRSSWRRRGAVPARRRGQVLEQHRGGGVRDLLVERRAVVGILDRDRPLVDDVAGVDAGVEVEHRVPGLGLAVDDRPVHRRSAPVARQQAGVEPDRAEAGQREQGLAEQARPADDEDEVGPELGDPGDLLGPVQVADRQQRDAQPGGEVVEGDPARRGRAEGRVEGHDGVDALARLDQRLETAVPFEHGTHEQDARFDVVHRPRMPDPDRAPR